MKGKMLHHLSNFIIDIILIKHNGYLTLEIGCPKCPLKIAVVFKRMHGLQHHAVGKY